MTNGQRNPNILLGWGEIESFAGESRKTLIKKGYPIRKDQGKLVWIDKEQIVKHRRKISTEVNKPS